MTDTDIMANHNRLVAEAKENLAELTSTLSNKITILGELKAGRGADEHERLSAKARGIGTGLKIAQESESPSVAYWAMSEALSTTPEDERPGLEIAIQDAMLISRL